MMECRRECKKRNRRNVGHTATCSLGCTRSACRKEYKKGYMMERRRVCRKACRRVLVTGCKKMCTLERQCVSIFEQSRKNEIINQEQGYLLE